MASGRMEFHADTIMQHTNFSFVLPNDFIMEEIKEPRHYDRPTKSLILLHGLTGTDTDWLYGGVAQEMAKQYNLAVFMPTVGNFFYLDHGYEGGNFASFIGEELPEYIRDTFGYCINREDTMIAGLSMGGFGAIHTALQFPDTFSSCVALSSALEYLYRGLKEEGKEIPRIYMAIGTEDSLYEVNCDFRRFLENEGADFFFEDGPGAHTWDFWNKYLPRGIEWMLK